MGSGKIRHLLGDASVAESGVPMRIPAEPRDDLAMLPSVAITAVAAFAQQIVIAQRLAVHQRHIEKT